MPHSLAEIHRRFERTSMFPPSYFTIESFGSSETSVRVYHATHYHFTEDNKLQLILCQVFSSVSRADDDAAISQGLDCNYVPTSWMRLLPPSSG